MSSSSTKRSQTQSSDSGTPPVNRYKKVCSSPSLRAFSSFAVSMGQFENHIETKIDSIGIEPVDLLRTELARVENKCERVQDKFKSLISKLDKAIENYERKKPTDLAANANSVFAPEKQAAYRSSSPKIKNTTEIFAALNTSIGDISAVIDKKIYISMYEDYSSSVEKKLKNLKNMCEANIEFLEEISKKIKHAIDKNEEI